MPPAFENRADPLRRGPIAPIFQGPTLVQPEVFPDERGLFLPAVFGGDSAHLIHISHSRAGTLRGLHFQNPTPQGKQLLVLSGAIFDVAVDLRRSSPEFGKVHTFTLHADIPTRLAIPAGFAHGFYALEHSIVAYAVDAPYAPAHEWSLAWNDPQLAIPWPGQPSFISEKDRDGLKLGELPDLALFP